MLVRWPRMTEELPTLLVRVVDECADRIARASTSTQARELGVRAAAVRAKLDELGLAKPSELRAAAETALDLAEDVLGRIDPMVEALRAWLRASGPSTPVGVALRLSPGAMVDARYAIQRELGRGAMGVVYLARDTNLERNVALKLIYDATDVDDAAERFRREASALASVRSENVVQVYAFGDHGGAHFLAMEHVEGSPLDESVAAYARAGEAIPVARVVTILVQVARGLAAVHAAGVVHRDVKPSNIVIEERTGRPVLIDFGLALRKEDERHGGDVAAGTPHYMAPEQIVASSDDAHAQLVTPRTDVYALGSVAFELLTGRTPFEAKGFAELLLKQAEVVPDPPSYLRPSLGDFDGPILRALAKRPADRFVSCADFADALEAAYRAFASPGPTLPPPPGESEGPAQSAPFESAPEAPVESARVLPRVLVVDDDETIRTLFARCATAALGTTNVDLASASSGEEALAHAAARMPDLVLLDYNMPGLDGVETLSRLRALPHGTRTRVVVVSAAGSELPKWKFAVLGVGDFVAKPVRVTAFIELLKDVARNAGWQLAAR